MPQSVLVTPLLQHSHVIQGPSQPANIYSKLTIEALEQDAKCLKLIIKTPERRNWHHSSVFIVTLEHVIAGWDGVCTELTPKAYFDGAILKYS